jgi:DNA repair protein RadD
VIVLRDYQQQLYADIHAEWGKGARNVLAVAPTGSGKTSTFAKVIHDHPGASIAIAHRNELVSQISLTLARNGVRHRIIGSHTAVRACVGLHVSELGRSYFDQDAAHGVAGVDTLVKRPPDDPWFRRVSLWVQDEVQHLLADNKWGKATALFPNAKGLGVTATPTRADGRGLGRHADGLMDAMVESPGMRELIGRGFLTDYRIFAPPSDINLANVPTSASGDFSPEPLRVAVHKSHVVGDTVQHYLRIAPGKLGVTFAVDVEGATELAAAYRQAGVPAEVVSANTPPTLRAAILARFARGDLKQLVNVDLFGEGFDLPAIEVVSMARPTQSFGLYAQQFGRALRPMENKSHAVIIDHVSNVLRHGLPDAPRVWTLDRRERRTRGKPDDVIPVRTCPSCLSVYERIYRECPFCGHYPEPTGRSGPEMVDGDLAELSPEALARLRGEIDKPLVLPFGAAPEVVGAVKKRHREREQAQAALREAMAQWGGARVAEGMTLSQAQRRFYLDFGIDVASAQALGRADADTLRGKLE